MRKGRSHQEQSLGPDSSRSTYVPHPQLGAPPPAIPTGPCSTQPHRPTHTLDEYIEVLVILAGHVAGHTQVSARIRDLRGLDLEQSAFPQDAEPLVGGHGLGAEEGE